MFAFTVLLWRVIINVIGIRFNLSVVKVLFSLYFETLDQSRDVLIATDVPSPLVERGEVHPPPFKLPGGTMRKYYKLALLTVTVVSVVCLVFYKAQYDKLYNVLEVRDGKDHDDRRSFHE